MGSGRLFVGTSGFAYKEWIGPFYPPGTKSAGMLGYYAGQFGSVEVNYTFRRSPTASMMEGWSAATPDGFVSALAAVNERHGSHRYAMEFRHPSFDTDEVRSKLGAAGVALCVADTEEQPVRFLRTGDFAYVRL